MKSITASLALFAGLSLLGCGTGGTLGPSLRGPQSRAGCSTPRATLEAPGATGGSEQGYPVPPAPTARSVERGAQESARADRPGLGTEWGEARVSRVRDVTFQREAERPFSIASVYYNDRAGVEAMASYEVRGGAGANAAVPVSGGLSISVLDETGAPLPSFSVAGRVYVAGEAGRRYALLVRNHTDRRYEIVASVDGLDVVDGKPASLGKRGYVIDPRGTLLVDGFRRSRDEVAAFRFGAVADSYAARTGSDRNVGVIGVALFAEAGSTPWSDDEIEQRRAAEPFSDARYAHPPSM